MRSRLYVCAALAGTCLFGTWSPVARAADPKGKSKKSTTLSDDKALSKQLQWEDSVMGTDDKQSAELAKIRRAQAINKAAAAKAAKEKEKADAQAARDKEKEDAARARTAKRDNDVALPDEEPASKPKVEVAAPPPRPVKHGDDKFIDKLLSDDGSSKKHKAAAVDDKALDDLLAVDKPKAASKGKKKGDDVDSLLSSADKAPPMPETHAKREVPEWAKPEIASTPVEPTIPLRAPPRRDDGIIHVVQGAAVPASETAPARRTASAAPTPPRGHHRQAASVEAWNDPFVASGPRKSESAAARENHSDSGADDLDFAIPVNRRHRGAHGSRHTAPAVKANKAKWKDPFTENEAPAALSFSVRAA